MLKNINFLSVKYNILSKFFLVTAFFLIFTTVWSEITSPRDSIGTEKKGNKILVLHKVSSGESLSVIARKYKTSVSEILAENDLKDQKIKIDEVIKVPYISKPIRQNTISRWFEKLHCSFG